MDYETTRAIAELIDTASDALGEAWRLAHDDTDEDMRALLRAAWVATELLKARWQRTTGAHEEL